MVTSCDDWPLIAIPRELPLSRGRGLLVVANTTTNRVTVLDTNTGQPAAHVAVPREPYHVAVTPDESLAIVSNLLPVGIRNGSILRSRGELD